MESRIMTADSDRPSFRTGGVPEGTPGSGSRGLHNNEKSSVSGAVRPHRSVESLDPEEMVATTDSATAVEALEAAAREHRLMISGVLPGECGTVGGLFSDPREGPADPCIGRFPDDVLGIEGIRGDGSAILSGGKVVKNVTGYDLVRLLGGAMGALGYVTRLHLRLEAAPTRWHRVEIEHPDLQSCWIASDIIRKLPFEPYVFAVHPDDFRITLLLAGSDRAVDERVKLIVAATTISSSEELQLDAVVEQINSWRSPPGECLRVRLPWQRWRQVNLDEVGCWRAIFPSAGYGLIHRWSPSEDLDRCLQVIEQDGGSVTAEDYTVSMRSQIPLVQRSDSDLLTRRLRALWDADERCRWEGSP